MAEQDGSRTSPSDVPAPFPPSQHDGVEPDFVAAGEAVTPYRHHGGFNQMLVTVCSPSPAHDILENESRFFRPQLPVSVRFGAGGEAVGTGLSFDDYNFCQTSKHGNWKRTESPSWCFDAHLLQTVITTSVERRADIYRPDTNLTLTQRLRKAEQKLFDRKESLVRSLDRACARFLELKSSGQDTAKAAIQVRTLDGQLRSLGRAGEITAAVIFLSLRVGYTSPQVSHFLKGSVSPMGVRTILSRCKLLAKGLENGTLNIPTRYGQGGSKSYNDRVKEKLCVFCEASVGSDTRYVRCHSCRTRQREYHQTSAA